MPHMTQIHRDSCSFNFAKRINKHVCYKVLRALTTTPSGTPESAQLNTVIYPEAE